MYTEFFGLNEKPFSISPDPRYLYLSRRHADALAHLIYGISESGGFIQLTGEVGTGKTTLIRSLLEQLPARAEIALILNPQLSTREFLESICEELRIPLPEDRSTKGYIDRLNVQLLRANAQDRRIVLIVDEAQTLSLELLEQVRLLTNLETAKKKLLQIILIGQPELRSILDRPEMRQVAQRVTGRYHLEPLSADETVIYVKHRMKVAGAHAEVFAPSAIRELFRVSGGIPRLINIVADRALLAAYTQERSKIDGRLVRIASSEVFGKRTGRRWWPWAAIAAGLAAFALTTTTHYDVRDQNPQLTALAIPEAIDEPAPAASDAANAEAATLAQTESTIRSAERSPSVLETLLADDSFPTDGASAARELFRLWNASYDPSRGTACAQAESQRLRCKFTNGGSLGELRRLNRPAIITLTDFAGTDHQVVLSGLDYREATLSGGGHSATVDVADLTHYWFGTSLLLWKPILLDTEDLAPGARGEHVVWLRESLQQILGAPIPADEPLLFDEVLADRVREFQRRQRLAVDGVVGVQTQIVIQTLLHLPGMPLLSEVD